MSFREYVTSGGLRVFGGKSADGNDELVGRAGANDVMLHTSEPGSPFVNVGEKPSKKDVNEAGVFCAKYSQDWRDSKKDVVVNIFLRKDMNKSPKMKAGLWSVKKQKKILVKKEDVFKFEKVLRSEGIALGE